MSARRNLAPLRKGDRVRNRAGRRGVVMLGAETEWLKSREVEVRWFVSGEVERVLAEDLYRTHKARG